MGAEAQPCEDDLTDRVDAPCPLRNKGKTLEFASPLVEG